MNPPASCPPPDDLGRLLLGQLAGPDAERWLLHLETCPLCLQKARDERAIDPLVEAFRTQPEPRIPAHTRDLPTPSSPLDSPTPVPRHGPRDLPGYQLLGEIGRGGMGVVHLARQLGANRLVALKMIRAGAQATASQRVRFRAEAEAVARLQDPSIVALFEVGEHDDCPFLALELVDGISLDRRLAGGPLPCPEAAALVERLARAMHHAHERGVVHRDLNADFRGPPNLPK